MYSLWKRRGTEGKKKAMKQQIPLLLLLLTVAFILCHPCYSLPILHLKSKGLTKETNGHDNGIVMTQSDREMNHLNAFKTVDREMLTGTDIVPCPQPLETFIISFHSSHVVYNDEFYSTFEQMSQGVTLSNYLPHDSFVVQATRYQLSLIAHLPYIEQILEYESKHKIDNSVYNLEEQGSGGGGDYLQSVSTKQKSWEFLIIKLFKSNGNHNLVDDYRSLLNMHHIEYKNLAETSPGTLILLVSRTHVQEAAELFSKYPTVQWIEREIEEVIPEVKNVNWAVQSGELDYRPFSEVGLTGKEQVIAIADTGVDVNSCYFYDPDHAVPFVDDYLTPIYNHSSKHRSIELYFAFMDKYDAVNGHGTHVSGIASGSFYSTLSNNVSTMYEYNGIAPDAKIVMFDVGCQILSGCTCAANTPSGACPCDKTGTCSYGQLHLPTDLRAGYFSKAYEAGARIHSNSLGSTVGEPYNDKSVAIDEFTYEHDDFLIIWSAGNSGQNQGFSTLTGSYKQAKNNIVVGASLSPTISWIEKYTLYENYTQLLQTRQYQLYSMYACGCNSNNLLFCRAVASLSGDCCSLMGSKCNLRLAQALPGVPFTNIALDCCMKCNLAAINSNLIQYDMESIAYISSLGPTMDGRVKPDVVAPGFFVFAARGHGNNSDEFCNVTQSTDPSFYLEYKAGTSMSTPAVASVAALVRQFFLEGRYMLKGQNISMNPSAALVKACIIAGARPMLGYAQNSQLFANLVPSIRRFYEGHGFINLSNVLPLNDSLSLFVQDRKPITQGEEHSYKVKYNAQQIHDFSVTLVWTDYPAASFTSFALVNDLDLCIEYVNKTTGENVVLWGNSYDISYNRPDRINNVEKILLDKSLNVDSFIVRVTGHLIPTKTQNYSLVITGGTFDNGQVADSFTVSPQKTRPQSKTSVNIPIWLLTLLIAAVVTLGITSGGLMGLILLLKRRQASVKPMNSSIEMKENLLDSNYYVDKL
jgi:subtilisin family serine protease